MRRTLLSLVLASLATLVPALAPAGAAARGEKPLAGRYIVVYRGSVSSVNRETDQRERRDGFRSRLRYSHAVKGFAASLSPGQVGKLRSDPEVASVTPDYAVHALGAIASGDSAPTGVRRIEAASTTDARDASTVNVAVIDTGIDQTHPDLNAAGGKNCVTAGASPNDDNGHGSHVAGTIGARNNGAGVVGVAPGTKLFAAKVLNAQGSGTASQVICGIDWVTSTRTDSDPTNDVAVANMSLGGTGTALDSCPNTTDPEHKAICNSTAAGVTYVVAAGNSGWDYDFAPQPDVPAAYPEVLTVSAVSDSDGQPGGTGGAPSCRTTESDDKFASFSNYAATTGGLAHTIAGPGVCIRSTWMNGGYNTISGTSMATPHLTGSVALCLGEGGASGPCTGLTPAQVVQKMRDDAQSHTTSVPGFGFTGDPLHNPPAGRYYGYLAWDGSSASTPPPPPPPAPTNVSATPSGTTIQTGSLLSGSAADLASSDDLYFQVRSSTSKTRTSDWYGSFSGVPSTLSNLKVSYEGKNSLTCSQTVSIFRFTDNTWVTLDSRSVGSTDVPIVGLAPGGVPSAYVSAGGQLRVRVRCTTRSGQFTSSGDLLQITYDQP
jgi:subtilisin